MRSKTCCWLTPLLAAAAVAAATPARAAGIATVSHVSSSLPGAAGPAITLLSASVNNNGTDLVVTLTFANPTIEAPSSGNADGVFGFINLDADKSAATGYTGSYLDTNSYESGFGRYAPNSQGVDAYISLSSEYLNDILLGTPGQLDVVPTNTFLTAGSVTATYANQAGVTPSTLTLSVPLSLLTSGGITPSDTGNFSVIVGNANNATDYLVYPAAVVPEPSSLALGCVALACLAAFARRPGAGRVTSPK